MNPVSGNQPIANTTTPPSGNSAIANFVNSTNITRSAKSQASLAEKIGIDVAKREEEKKTLLDHAEKMSLHGPLSFKSGEAPDFIKDKVTRETGKTFSTETDYIIHHPGDKLFYVRRKTGNTEVPNEYLNFTISDADITEAKKPVTVRGDYMMDQVSDLPKSNSEINKEPNEPIQTAEVKAEPVIEINEQDRLLSRKNILSRIAEQYRTQEDKDELAQIELKLQGTTPAVISPEVVNNNQEIKSETVTTGTLGTISMPTPQTEPVIEVVNEPYIETPIPTVEPVSPVISEVVSEPVVTEVQPITFESPEVIEDVKPELSLIQQATSVVDIHNALEKMDGIETLTSHVGFAEAWDKTKKFIAGEITKAELPDNDEFLEKLTELKKTHDDELALLGVSIKQQAEIKDISDESEDVTDIIKPRHIISGKDVEVTDDDDTTADLSDSQRDLFNSLFKNIAPAKKIEIQPVSVPLQMKEVLPVEIVTAPERKINRVELAKKYQVALRKAFNLGKQILEITRLATVGDITTLPNKNETMTAVGKKEPEALFS